MMRKHGLAILFMFFLIAAFFSSEIFSKDRIFAPVDAISLYSPWNESAHIIPRNFQQGDALFQFIPWSVYAYEQLREKNFPLWNPYEYGGIPFFANDQSGVLSIFNIIRLPFSFDKGFLLVAIIKLLMAAVGMYLFLTLFSLNPASCITGSIAYAFSALMITWLYHPVSSVAAFIPWLFWAFERLYRNSLEGIKSDTFISLFIASLIVALSFFSGHSETTVNALFGITVYYTTKAVIQHKKLIVSMSMLVSSIMIGFLLAAVQTLPFLQLLLDSVPFYARSSFPVNPSYFKIYLPFQTLLAWLVPNKNGNPSFSYFWMKVPTGLHEAVPYIGIAPLLLGIITLVRIKPDYKRLLPFWIMVFLGFGMAYGIPVIKWLTMLPLIRAGGAFRYIIFMEFGLAALSAFGIEMLVKQKPEHAHKSYPVHKALSVLFAVCFLSLILYLITRHESGLAAVPLGRSALSGYGSLVDSQTLAFVFIQIIVSILFISGTVWFIVKAYKRQLNGWLIPAGFIALSVTDLFIFGIGYNPNVPARDFYPGTPVINELKASDIKDYSFYASGGIIPPDIAMVYHIRDFRGYDMITSMKYQNFLYLMFPEEHPDLGELGFMYWPEKPAPVMAGIAGIKYFIFPKSFNPDNKFFRLIDSYGGVSLWENPLALPAYYLAQRVIPASNDDTALLLLSKTAPGDIETPVVQGIDVEHSFRPGKIRLTEVKQKPGEHIFDVRAGSEGFLVLNEPLYPGWHASINNRPVTLYHTNYLYQGIELPEGNYTVKFEYEPGIFYTGLKISVIVFMIMSSIAIGIVIV